MGVLGSAEVLIRVLIFATAVVATRVLGPREIGAVAVAAALINYAGVLGDGGLTTLAQVRLVRAGSRDDGILVAMTMIQVITSLALTALVIVVSQLLPLTREVKSLTALGAPLLLAQALNAYYALQADERMRALAGIRVAGQVVTSCACLVALAAGAGGTAVIASQWIGLLVGDALCVVALTRARRVRWMRPDRGLQRRLLIETVPYLGALIATQLIFDVDVVFLGLARPQAEVGRYSAALRLSAAALTVIAVLITAVFPELVRRLDAGGSEANTFIGTLVRLSCRPAFAAASVVSVLAPQIVTLLFGETFRGAGGYLAVLILMVPIGYYNSILAQSLVAAGRRLDYLRAVVITAAVTVVALLLTISRYGGHAAAAIVVGGEMLSATTLTLSVRRQLDLEPLPTFLAQLPFLVVPGGAGLLLQYAAGTSTWVTTSVVVVVIAGCEVLAPTGMVMTLRGIRGTPSNDEGRQA